MVTAEELNQMLMSSFPEIKDELPAYMEAEGEGMATGCFLTHEDVFHPFIEAALESGNTAILRCVGNYVDTLLSTEDAYAINVATIGILEWLAYVHHGSKLEAFLGKRSLMLLKSFSNR